MTDLAYVAVGNRVAPTYGVVPFDLVTNTPGVIVPVPTPYTYTNLLGFSPSRDFLYVASYDPSSQSSVLLPFNTGSNAFSPSVATSLIYSPNGGSVSLDGKWVAIANGSYTIPSVVLVNLTTGDSTAISPGPGNGGTGVYPTASVFSLDSSVLYQLVGSGTVNARLQFIEVASATLGTSIPFVNTYFSGGMALSPDGARVWLAGTISSVDYLYAVDTSNNSIATQITIPHGAWNVTLSPDGNTAYVSSESTGYLTIVDIASDTIVNTILVHSPADLIASAVTTDGSTLYLVDDAESYYTNYENAIYPVDLKSLTVGNFISTPSIYGATGIMIGAPTKTGVWSIGGLALSA